MLNKVNDCITELCKIDKRTDRDIPNNKYVIEESSR